MSDNDDMEGQVTLDMVLRGTAADIVEEMSQMDASVISTDWVPSVKNSVTESLAYLAGVEDGVRWLLQVLLVGAGQNPRHKIINDDLMEKVQGVMVVLGADSGTMCANIELREPGDCDHSR